MDEFRLIALTHFDSKLGVEAHIIAVASSLNCLNWDRGYFYDCFDFHLSLRGKSFKRFCIVP